MNEIKCGVFEVKEEKNIFVIGDIHGDYQCLIHCLVDLCDVCYTSSIYTDNEFNEPVREYINWKNDNDSILIFSGDLIHRKRYPNNILDDECSDVYIIKTILRLKEEAQRANGDIIIVSGNHEIMNILDPMDIMYTSGKNIQKNHEFFTNVNFVNNYIKNSYAWIVLNDILIAHGGLCSDYLRFIDNENIFDKKIFTSNENKSLKSKYINGNEINNNKSKSQSQSQSQMYIMYGGEKIEFGYDIIHFINNKYKDFFTNYDKTKINENSIEYKLFIDYDFKNKHKHNMFWCRQWGYSGVDCLDFSNIIEKIGCEKMIIAHCPQFIPENKAKMINFECALNSNSNNTFENCDQFKIARIDVGMSRSFEYNKSDYFIKYLSSNYNRKMSVLKLLYNSESKKYYFNYNSVKTQKISCIQYLLLKYGKTKNEWEQKNIHSNWLGFEYIERIINHPDKNNLLKCDEICDKSNKSNKTIDSVLCLLYPLYCVIPDLKSIKQFNELI